MTKAFKLDDVGWPMNAKMLTLILPFLVQFG